MNSYEALRSRAAYIDLSGRGQIRVTGEDRARLLHAMSTNDVNRLEEHHGLYAFFLTAQGRIIADANIYNLGDSLWLDTEPELREKLVSHLDKYIIADDVTLEDETGNWAVLGVEGPEALDLAVKLAGTCPKPILRQSLGAKGSLLAWQPAGPAGSGSLFPAPGSQS